MEDESVYESKVCDYCAEESLGIKCDQLDVCDEVVVKARGGEEYGGVGGSA